MTFHPEEQAPAPDPWKSFRGVMAGTLILEAIAVLLALPVVAVSHGGLTQLSGSYLIGLGEPGDTIRVDRRRRRSWRHRLHRRDIRRGLAANRVPAGRGQAPGGARVAAWTAAAAGLITPPSVQL